MNVRLEDITKKHPFIYKIKDNYYIIGCGVFALCKSQLAISHYQKYRESINRLGREFIQEHHYDYSEDFDSLIFYFRKIMAYADVVIVDEDVVLEKRNIYEFLDSLDKREKVTLINQIEDYMASFWYYSRKFE